MKLSSDSFALKYRPKNLSELIGQPVIVRTLTNAFNNNKLHHAYLFVGQLGCGKTSCARILAAMENCESGRTLTPCEKCSACQDIFEGTHEDVTEIDAASNAGKVEQIRLLKDQARFSPIAGARKKYIILDECLGHNSRVETEDGLMCISVIVNNRISIKVKSFNEETNKIEYKNITNWFKNTPKPVYKLAFETPGRLYAAGNHKVYISSGKLAEIKNLNIGDKVLRLCLKPSYWQKQLIYGSLLGDMCIMRNMSRAKQRFNNCSVRFKVSHSAKQKEYVHHKYDVLKSFVKTPPKEVNNGDKLVCFTTTTSTYFVDIFNRVVVDGAKKINSHWLSELDWPAVAYWFCDDGSCSHHICKNGKISRNIMFATNGFSYDENKLLVKWFYSNAIKVDIKEDKRGRGYYLYVPTSETPKLLRKITPYIPKSMIYKVHNFKSEMITLNNTLDYGLIAQKITFKELTKFLDPHTYDIEVEDNHNYFVSGTLVHNCHRMTGPASEALLKLIEEPPDHVRFILCTTETQKITGTIASRCQKHEFKKIFWKHIAQHLVTIAKAEGIKYEEGKRAIALCAKLSDGSMRNAEQHLEALISFSGKNEITDEEGQSYFGQASENVYYDMIDAIINEIPNASTAYKIINSLLATGTTFPMIADGIMERLDSLNVVLTASDVSDLLSFSESGRKRLEAQRNKCHKYRQREAILAAISDLRRIYDSAALGMNEEKLLRSWVVKSIIEFQRCKNRASELTKTESSESNKEDLLDV